MTDDASGSPPQGGDQPTPGSPGGETPAAGEPRAHAPTSVPEGPTLDAPIRAQLVGASSTRVILVAAAAVVILIGMRIAADVVTPVLTALVITVALSPILAWQVRHRVPTGVAFMTTVVVSAVVGILIMALMTASLASFAADLPDYAEQLQPYWDWIKDGLAQIGINVNDLLDIKNIDPKTVLSTGADLATGVVGLLSDLSLMALTVFFMLLEATSISGKLQRGMAGDALRRIGEVSADMRAFIKVTTYMGAVVAVLDTLLLLALGVPNAVLWGLLSFFLSFIPFIGFVIALIPPVLLALVTGGWIDALIVFAGYWVINGVSDNLVKPRIMGSQTNLAPLWVFLSVLLWGWVLGPIGGLLAVPVTLLVKRLVLEAFDEWRWMSVIIGDTPKEGGEKPRRQLRLPLPHRKRE